MNEEDDQTSFVNVNPSRPSKEQIKQLYRVECPVCHNPLYLRIVGFLCRDPIGFIPICKVCGFRDWGHII